MDNNGRWLPSRTKQPELLKTGLRARASALPQVPGTGLLGLFSNEDRSDDSFQGWADADPAEAANILYDKPQGYLLTDDYTKALSVVSSVGTQQNLVAENDQNGNPYIGPQWFVEVALGTGTSYSYDNNYTPNIVELMGVLASPAAYSESAVWTITPDGNADMIWVNPEGSTPATYQPIAFFEVRSVQACQED
ncbi:hypothetical protein MNV49_007451 [Pseudohyphozyma bogoriensis]|nr:hypothetical protein MNV49_007451 [Pseudohyphozyma bogoriensis]